jgi:hypothetical protein
MSETQNPAPQSTAGKVVEETTKQAKGFLSMLFDFSFKDFITVKIIKVLYGIFMVVAGLAALSLIVTGFMASVVIGIIYLLLSPLVFLLYVIMARMWLEIVMVMFKINDNVEKISKK